MEDRRRDTLYSMSFCMFHFKTIWMNYLFKTLIRKEIVASKHHLEIWKKIYDEIAKVVESGYF